MKDVQCEDLIELKIVLIGEGSLIGKTSIRERFTKNTFTEQIPTIWGGYSQKKIQFDKYIIKLHIFDTRGSDRFRSLNELYIRDAHGIIFVCDITDYHSFESMKILIEGINKKSYSYVGIICANKCDLDEEREISREKIEKYGLSQNMEVFEVSAKTGKNINEVFYSLVKLIISKNENKEINTNVYKEKILYNFRLDLIVSSNCNSKNEILNHFCDDVDNLYGHKILEFNKNIIRLILYFKDIKNKKDYYSNRMKYKIDGKIYFFDVDSFSSFENIKNSMNKINQNNSEKIMILILKGNKTNELFKKINDYPLSQEIKVFKIDKICDGFVKEIFAELTSLILKNKGNTKIYEIFNQYIIYDIYQFRFAFIGDKYSGTSELFEEYFNSFYSGNKILELNKYKIKLEIYNARDSNILELLNENQINGIIFIFSPDSLESFEKVKEFINNVKKNYKNEYKSIICSNYSNMNSKIISKEINNYFLNQNTQVYELNPKFKDTVDKVLVQLTYQILLMKKITNITSEFYEYFKHSLIINHEKKLNKYLNF